MAEDRIQRRLAAIFAADVVGYSRMMGVDEEGTLAALTSHRSELLEPSIAKHQGRVVKTTGDGLLAEFASVVDAVRCAVTFQERMAVRNKDVPDDRRIEFRIGVNLGDVIVQDGDVFGDGVNVAARIEALARPGGISISEIVHQSIAGKIDVAFTDGGERQVKNISKPVHVWEWRGDSASDPASVTSDEPIDRSAADQDIRFCTSADGTTIAYATVGHGRPLFRAPNWMTHLDFDWESPVWLPMNTALSRHHALTRFDQRANGLSDRDVENITFDCMIEDMEAVADAAGLDRFPILGISQGAAFAIAYAARHPERVTKLVLYGGFPRGALAARDPEWRRTIELQVQMIEHGWGQDNPAFRQFFATNFMPDADREMMGAFTELMRKTTSPSNAAQLYRVLANIDVSGLLHQITAPTLVLHCKGDAVAPFAGGRKLAAKIPNARFVSLNSNNHVMMGNEPAWVRFVDEVTQFLDFDAR